MATVKVNITDINDNAPVFTNVFYSFDVPEDTPIGTTIALVEAVDADQGLNGEVVYTLVSTWGQSIFHLDPQMGTIRLIKNVDYEQVKIKTDMGKDVFYSNIMEKKSKVIVFYLAT